VDAAGRDAVALQVVGQPVGAVLGARERDRALDLAALQKLDEQRGLQLAGDRSQARAYYQQLLAGDA
jgi:hypothetical protein